MHESMDDHTRERIMAGNDEHAEHNREHFDEAGTFVVNIMSAPGAGKTSLLEASIGLLGDRIKLRVVEGDMVGELDAERLRKHGTVVDQICTGRNCHLDALMISRLLHADHFSKSDLLFIENVGNLVCPAEFNLGEHKKVVLLSVTEGDDKPVKYPVIFRGCDAVVITKCDLLPYVNFNTETAIGHIKALNPDAKIFCLSATKPEDTNCISSWIEWLQTELEQYQQNFRGNQNVPVGAG